ncbi:site-specific integrase [Oxalobacter vibrioformis]|uniref:Site-specific integrase n=1 Tax=Oxalobacter vibrioformis TaxID=933080 RepID=A0A9E9LVI1_9BURK|nr:site-specific integrase [Oxalobacter vibrioformis]WAW10490.1 site-specific integrase [Oxalobacter vibrioformis]
MKRQLLRNAFEKYGATISILKKGYKQERYRIEQISRSFLGEKFVHKITSVDIATYRDQRLNHINFKTGNLISASSVRLEMSLLSNFFDIARIEWGLCEHNPVQNVRKPKLPPGRERRLTPREDRMILRYAHQHTNSTLYSIIVLALETAMRQGEIISLHWENIDLKKRVAHLPETKNGSKRDVPLSLRARDALVRLGQKNVGRVFHYTAEGIKSTWRFMLGKLGIADLHFHDLRHEAISRLFELGTLDVMEIAAISGHKNLSMLKRYTHLSAQKLAKKLETGKNRNAQHVIDMLVPYPAIVKKESGLYHVRLLDFEDMEIKGTSSQSAIRAAQDTLLRKIVLSVRMNDQFPLPDQYMESIDDSKVVMIDPLALDEMAVKPA